MFNNPLKKYQQGGQVSKEQQEMLAAFVEWLPKRVKDFQGMQPEQIVEALNGMTKTPEGQKQVEELMKQFQQDMQNPQPGMFKEGGKLHDFICKHAKGGNLAGCGCEKHDDGGVVVSTTPRDSSKVEYSSMILPIINRGFETVKFLDENGNNVSWVRNTDGTYQWKSGPQTMDFNPNQEAEFIPYSGFKRWNRAIDGSTRLSEQHKNELDNLFNTVKKEDGGKVEMNRGGKTVESNGYTATVNAPGDTTRTKQYNYRQEIMQTYPDGSVRYTTRATGGEPAEVHTWGPEGRPSFLRRLWFGNKSANPEVISNWRQIIANHPEDPRNVQMENGGVVKAQGGLAKIGKAVVKGGKSVIKSDKYVPEQALGNLPFVPLRFSKSISPKRYKAVIDWRLANDPHYKASVESMERAMQSMGNTDVAYDLYRLKNFGATNEKEFLQFEDMMNRRLTGNQIINTLKPRPGTGGSAWLGGDGLGHYAKEGAQQVFHSYSSGIGNFKTGGIVKGQSGIGKAAKAVIKAGQKTSKSSAKAKEFAKLTDKQKAALFEYRIPSQGLVSEAFNKIKRGNDWDIDRFIDNNKYFDNNILYMPTFKNIEPIDISKIKFTKRDPWDVADDIITTAGWVGVPATLGGAMLYDTYKEKKKQKQENQKENK